MSQIRLYLDEDSRSKKLLQALQNRGVDIITVAETRNAKLNRVS